MKSGRRVHIYAKLAVLVADEVALKEMMGCKGHGGTKPCVLCMHCVLHYQGGATPWWQRSSYFKSLAETNLSAFVLHTDDTVRQAIQTLHDAKGSVGKAQFEHLETQFGWNYIERNLVLEEGIRLNVVSCTMYDWIHTYVAGGNADTEFGIFMNRMRGTRTTYSEIGKYLAAWRLPSAWPDLAHLFEPKKAAAHYKNESFASSASEFLTLAPILTCYLLRVVAIRDVRMKPFIDSMIAVLCVVEILQAVKRGLATPQALKEAIQRHMQLFVAAYGRDACKPKHHFALHLPDIFARVGTLLGTLTNERRHRVVKRYTRDRRNLTRWELGALEEVTCHALWELTKPIMDKALVGAVVPQESRLAALSELFPHHARAAMRVSSEARGKHGTMKVGDFVFFESATGRHVGELIINIAMASEELSVVGHRREVGRSADLRLVQVSTVVNEEIVPCSQLLCVATHRPSEDSASSSVYLPWEWRR